MSGGVIDTGADGANDQGLISIVGPNDLFPVDTIAEDGIRKLQVKSSIVPQSLGELFFLKPENVTHGADMAQDGSTTPLAYVLNAESGLGAQDLVIQELRFSSRDGNVKLQNFMGLNAPLTTGISIDITTGGDTFSFLPINFTTDFDAHFSFGAGGKFILLTSSGGDYLSAAFSPENPFVLLKDTADKITININDDLSSIDFLELVAFGFKD